MPARRVLMWVIHSAVHIALDLELAENDSADSHFCSQWQLIMTVQTMNWDELDFRGYTSCVATDAEPSWEDKHQISIMYVVILYWYMLVHLVEDGECSVYG